MRRIILCVSLLCVLNQLLQSAPPGCLDEKKLTEADRERAVQLMWQSLDRETLFTYAGGLKPVNIGYDAIRIPADGSGDLKDVEQIRRISSAFECPGLFQAEVHHMDFIYDGKRSIQTVLFHLPHFREKLKRHADLFSPYGITSSANPLEVMMAIEYARGGNASLMLGYLLGYPEDAVDFFHAASREQSRTGQFVKRNFLNPSSFDPRSFFVWAVPLGYKKTAADEAIFQCAETILAEYKLRRPQYFGNGKPGPFALLRDWLDAGFPSCSSTLQRGNQ